MKLTGGAIIGLATSHAYNQLKVKESYADRFITLAFIRYKGQIIMSEYQPQLPYGGEQYVDPLSYNEFNERYPNEGYAGFSIHCLAYMLQQKRPGLDPKTIAEWENDLVGTRYEIKREEQ